MAETIQELLVKIRPDGVDETADGLERTEESFAETAEGVEEQTGLLEQFSQRFKGAMGVVVAGLGVAAAGLLAQIPVLGEAIAGLNLLLDSLILRLDEKLRPAITPITNALVDMSSAVLEADGPLGSLVDVLLVAGAAFAVLLAGALLVAGAIAAIGALISGTVVAAIALVAAAIGALFVAWQENWLGIRDITLVVLDTVLSTLRSFVAFSLSMLGKWLLIIVGLIHRQVNAFITGFEVLRNVVPAILRGMANLGMAAVEMMVNGIISMVNDAIAAMERVVDRAAEVASRTPGVDIQAADLGRVETIQMQRLQGPGVGEAAAQVARGAQRRAQRNRERESAIAGRIDQLVAAIQGAEVQHETNIDGQRVAETTEPFLGEEAANRGRGSGR